MHNEEGVACKDLINEWTDCGYDWDDGAASRQSRCKPGATTTLTLPKSAPDWPSSSSSDGWWTWASWSWSEYVENIHLTSHDFLGCCSCFILVRLIFISIFPHAEIKVCIIVVVPHGLRCARGLLTKVDGTTSRVVLFEQVFFLSKHTFDTKVTANPPREVAAFGACSDMCREKVQGDDLRAWLQRGLPSRSPQRRWRALVRAFWPSNQCCINERYVGRNSRPRNSERCRENMHDVGTQQGKHCFHEGSHRDRRCAGEEHLLRVVLKLGAAAAGVQVNSTARTRQTPLHGWLLQRTLNKLWEKCRRAHNILRTVAARMEW